MNIINHPFITIASIQSIDLLFMNCGSKPPPDVLLLDAMPLRLNDKVESERRNRSIVTTGKERDPC
jgi:hypothetical protein